MYACLYVDSLLHCHSSQSCIRNDPADICWSQPTDRMDILGYGHRNGICCGITDQVSHSYTCHYTVVDS